MASLAHTVYVKTPTEEVTIPWDLPEGDFATGETITSAVVTASPTGGSHIVFGSAAVNGFDIQAKVTAGVADTEYKVTLRIETAISGSPKQKRDYWAVLLCRSWPW